MDDSYKASPRVRSLPLGAKPPGRQGAQVSESLLFSFPACTVIFCLPALSKGTVKVCHVHLLDYYVTITEIKYILFAAK